MATAMGMEAPNTPAPLIAAAAANTIKISWVAYAVDDKASLANTANATTLPMA